jgi:hypothetical protein
MQGRSQALGPNSQNSPIQGLTQCKEPVEFCFYKTDGCDLCKRGGGTLHVRCHPLLG